MILSDSRILKEIDRGGIILSPFDEKYLNPNSVDLTLNPVCKVYHPNALIDTGINLSKEQLDELSNFVIPNNYLDTKSNNNTFEFTIPEEGFILQPNHLYLYSCNERIGVQGNLCAEVMGKSSLGRLGLDIHVCAGFMDSGFIGSLVLEMRTIYPLKIYPNMKICQVKFEEVCGVIKENYAIKKGSKYMNQTGVQESLMHKNFN